MSNISILPSSLSLLHLLHSQSSVLPHPQFLTLITQPLGSQLSSQSTSQLSSFSSCSTSVCFSVSAYQSTSPLMQHSPLKFNLEKELKVSVSISILLDCKVPSLTKLQDRVDVRVNVLSSLLQCT